MPLSTADNASNLQRIVFTRFVNQKLEVGKKPTIKDVVTDLGDGVALVNLLEVLSDKPFTGKALKPQKVKIQMVDQANRALQFAKDIGVKSQTWASAENLIDQEETPIMGLVWAVMQTFLKFGDDEDGAKLSAEDSLLMWVQNQTFGYDVEIKGFAKSFQDGVALAALINKFRPTLIDPKDLSAGKSVENMEKVFQAAQLYFDLERFIEPSDVQNLDSKSAFIFVSEFYYGIARQRKVDLACRRITKLVQYTVVNDEMRADYQTKSDALLAKLADVTATLNDRTIDNTMSGAQAKIEEFQVYKTDSKPLIVSSFLQLEGLYNHLAMRLAEHNRPKFEPGAKKSIPELKVALQQLEETEKERQIALVAELNRQIRLEQLNEQHQLKFDKLKAWQDKSQVLLFKVEDINSIGEAEYEINRLKNYNNEEKVVMEGSVPVLQKVSAELESEKFEHIAAVKDREEAAQAGFKTLQELSQAKSVVLDEALKKEIEKERLRLEFATQAAEFGRFVESQNELLEGAFFGFNLQEVEAFGTTIQEDFKAVLATSEQQQSAFKATSAEAEALGVVENRYTPYNLEELQKLATSLSQSQADCQTRYETELARQRHNDALCKTFAQLASAFVSVFEANKEAITSSSESLEAQLSNVEAKVAEDHLSNLAEIEKAQADIDAANVKNNPHSHYTSKDCAVQLEQYKSFLASKAAQLQEEIAHAQLKGLTKEQDEEIEAQFKQFDKDASGSLMKNEFKSCLYSLGEDKSSKMVEEIMEKFGSVATGISHEGFKAFMIEQLGDTDTKEEIILGWELVNKNEEVAKLEYMQRTPLREFDIKYLQDTAPAKGEGYDYHAWTESVFAR